jgi:hypothetical protein
VTVAVSLELRSWLYSWLRSWLHSWLRSSAGEHQPPGAFFQPLDDNVDIP